MHKKNVGRKEMSEIYRKLAVSYVETQASGEKKTMHQICEEYEKKTGIFINRSNVWEYVKKLREVNKTILLLF